MNDAYLRHNSAEISEWTWGGFHGGLADCCKGVMWPINFNYDKRRILLLLKTNKSKQLHRVVAAVAVGVALFNSSEPSAREKRPSRIPGHVHVSRSMRLSSATALSLLLLPLTWHVISFKMMLQLPQTATTSTH